MPDPTDDQSQRPQWGARVRVGAGVWLVTIVMAFPVGVATLLVLLVMLEAAWESPSPGTPVLMVGTCAAMLGAGAGLVARLTRGWVLRTSGNTLRAESATAVCAVTVAVLLILVDLQMLGGTPGVLLLLSLPPVIAAACAHLRWPDSPLAAGCVAAGAATVATLFLGF